MRVVNLGLVPYDKALDLQHRLVAARKAGQIDDVLLLLEHPPVITLGRRGDQSNIVASPQLLAQLGIQVFRVERGGDVTYHGPRQLVGYPILDLTRHRQDVGWYVRSLEEVMRLVLADFGIESFLIEGLIGVWVKVPKRRVLDWGLDWAGPQGQGEQEELIDAKILAIGARIEQWITYHGFALNVDPDMSHFNLIVPCGIHDKAVVSMRQVLDKEVDFEAVRQAVIRRFGEIFAVPMEEATLADLELDFGASPVI